MELSIEQLADLKIAIKGESKKYDELKQTNEGLVVVNSNLTSNNKRLEKEIDEQVRIKEATIEENNKLRAEKEGINSEFEIKSNKQYEELRIKEQEIGDKLALIEARSKELEDRELKLFEKNEEIDRKISDLQQTKKEVKEDMIKSEKRLIEAREKETDIIKRETYLDKKDNDVRELLEVNEQEQEKIKKERKEILEISKKNQNALIETQAIEERMKADISRNEKLVVLLDETKNYLIGLEVVTKEELLGFIDKKFNGEEV
ncbi:hypothetical protein EOM39_03405, partial [Candidatus Gracilibacteria bacterium]|nr:hypothetical protein [Candidatus Gracilibacteria bacterium]